ncbi:ribonuclease H-like domain-containing protein [Tanacetum coccineum]
MFVHNSKYNSPINSDHDDDIYNHNPITRISKLDISDPLHLHPNDTTVLTVVLIKLKGTENYQNGSSIADYYHKLNALWKQYDAMIELPKCVCNASEETLPDVRSAYATISSEESYRVTVGSIAGSSQRNQASAFVSNVPNSQNFQRSNQNFSAGPSRPNNLNNNRQDVLKSLDILLILERKKSGQNFKKQSVSNNNSVGKSSSFGFTDEQMATLISLIKDNKVGKNVLANMAGANQHMTYTSKELDNVLDISHLRIKVCHPNETEAYISKIGNLVLSNGLTLYDVMVIPEYCVTLIYVHKLVKENKHDWHCRLGHPADPVLNVLKDTLQIDKKDNIVCCEICQRAKQTREPFSLSDHTSKSNNNTTDFPVDSANDADSSDDFVATQNEEEMDALLRNGTWEIVELPEGRKAIGKGIDYEETFSPIVKMVAVRCLLNIVMCMSWPVFQLDVNNAFLYGDLEEVVYMKPPEGYFPSDNKVCRLKKSLYGLKHAPRQWNAKLTSTLIENGFSHSKSDYSLYTKSGKGVFLAVRVCLCHNN